MYGGVEAIAQSGASDVKVNYRRLRAIRSAV
jgi:hypothetical protein